MDLALSSDEGTPFSQFVIEPMALLLLELFCTRVFSNVLLLFEADEVLPDEVLPSLPPPKATLFLGN